MSEFRSLKKYGVSRKWLERYLRESGYWNTARRRERNACELTPYAHMITERELIEVYNPLARVAYQSLEKVSAQLAMFSRSAPKTREEQMLFSIAMRASSGLEQPHQEGAARIPPVIKIDLVQAITGEFYIAEIDAYNPRGLGFNALLDGSALESYMQDDPSAGYLFGTIATVSSLFGKQGFGNRVGYIISERERYYNAAFEILKNALMDYDIALVVIREADLAQQGALSTFLANVDGNVFHIPDAIENLSVKSALFERYQQGSVNLFFPPKAYLGSKALLPYIREQPGMDRYIPETHLVSKYHNCDNLLTVGDWILKKASSSGMKGVYRLSTEREEFLRVYREQRQAKRPSFVLQRFVEPKTHQIEIYQDDVLVPRTEYCRFIMQATRDGCIGLDITGRPDPAVHGAKDCTMMPTIITPDTC